MSVDATKFRADFPEFGDETQYTDPQIGFWLGLAAQLLNAYRFADIIDYATELFVAHQLTLAARNQKSRGAIVAPASAKSVDKVSVTYDVAAVRIENAGHWNGTSHGIQFYQLVQLAGAGGVQL